MEEQIFDQNSDDGDGLSISDMTNKAKEEMEPKKKEEPEPKKETENKEEGSTDDFAESIVKDLNDAGKDKNVQTLAEDGDKKAEKAPESKPAE